jgi:glutathione synthase/RimK-type ligase-like ATP-grasp enzyme
LQTKIANEVGLKVPDFIVSSNYTDVKEFCNTYKQVIIKALSDTPFAYSQGEFKNPEDLDTVDFAAPYTTRLPYFDEKIMSRLDGSPCFIQEEIIKASDIRVSVIDNQLFAVEIPYHEGRPIDFRQAPIDGMKPVVLSENIEKKTIELLKRMRVRFASCDFIRDVKDNIYFLEANVQGNWLWTETDDFHISRAIAKALTNGA